jgi:hypothetical protein
MGAAQYADMRTMHGTQKYSAISSQHVFIFIHTGELSRVYYLFLVIGLPTSVVFVFVAGV